MRNPPTALELLQKCTPKEQKFILLLVANPTMSQRDAYLQAGFRASSPGSADANASKCLRKDGVSRALAAMRQQVLGKAIEKAQLSAERVLEEVRRLAFVDVAGCFDDAGNLKPLKDWTVEQRAALAGFEVIIKNAEAGGGVTDIVHKIRMESKTKNLELLMRHFMLLADPKPTDSEDWDKWAARLAAARNRPAAAEGRSSALASFGVQARSVHEC